MFILWFEFIMSFIWARPTQIETPKQQLDGKTWMKLRYFTRKINQKLILECIEQANIKLMEQPSKKHQL